MFTMRVVDVAIECNLCKKATFFVYFGESTRNKDGFQVKWKIKGKCSYFFVCFVICWSLSTDIIERKGRDWYNDSKLRCMSYFLEGCNYGRWKWCSYYRSM